MTSYLQRKKRTAEVTTRAKQPDHMYSYCRVIGCRKPARAGTSDGFDERYCRSHAEHRQRHGSVFKGSYTAAQLNPYRRVALEWITAHKADFFVANAVQRVLGLYRSAGPHIEAFRLRGQPPAARAKAAWARLRRHEVDPRLVIAAWLAVELVIRDDPQPVLTNEFRRVQAAKVIHRMASGTHKRWEREVPDPRWSGQVNQIVVQEMHTYPRPRGRVLRHIGEDLERAVELIVDRHMDALQAFTQDRLKVGEQGGRPWPKGWASRMRPTRRG